MPADVDLTNLDLDGLMNRTDIKTACSATLMQERSKDPTRTRGWTINAWPIPTPVGSTPTYLHCVAGNGATTGSDF